MEDPNNPFAPRGPVVDPTNPYASPLAEEAQRGVTPRSDRTLNPWFSMWTQPRATIRQIIETDPRHQVLLVTALGGASDMVDISELEGTFNFNLGMLAVQMVAGAVGAIIGLFLMGWVIKVVASWFGGTGSTLHTRAALGWGYVPAAWLLPAFILINLAILTIGVDVEVGNSRLVMAVYLVGAFLMIVIALWQLVITCQAVGEVHRISAMGAFGVMFLAGILVLGVVLILVLPFVFLLV